VDQERKDEIMERGLEALTILSGQTRDQSLLKPTVELLFKVLSNVKASPMDAKVRNINKSGKAYQGKLAPFPAVFQFL